MKENIEVVLIALIFSTILLYTGFAIGAYTQTHHPEPQYPKEVDVCRLALPEMPV